MLDHMNVSAVALPFFVFLHRLEYHAYVQWSMISVRVSQPICIQHMFRSIILRSL